MKIKKSEIKINPISFDRIPVLVEYRLDYLTELLGETNDSKKDQLKNELISYFTKKLEEKLFFALVAETEERILGFGAMVIKEIPGDFSKSVYPEGDILNMYTIPEARRQGISSMILERLIAEAKIRGISKLSLHTSKDGELLYRNFGFTEPDFPYLELLISK